MLWFKKKERVEDFMENIMGKTLPRSLEYFRKENERVHRPLSIKDSVLAEVGAGMCLFYLGKHFPEDDAAERRKMSRAFRVVEKHIGALNGTAGHVHTWWKAFTDGLIFHENEERLTIASRVAWDKLLPDIPYREPSPLKAFAYYLHMEMDAADKVKLI